MLVRPVWKGNEYKYLPRMIKIKYSCFAQQVRVGSRLGFILRVGLKAYWLRLPVSNGRVNIRRRWGGGRLEIFTALQWRPRDWRSTATVRFVLAIIRFQHILADECSATDNTKSRFRVFFLTEKPQQMLVRCMHNSVDS
jgi:hypothetical protein